MFGVNFIGNKFKLFTKVNEQRITDYLPYNFFIGKEEEGIVLLKPGALMRCYTFMCPDLGSSSAETINAVSVYFNQALKRLGDGWACFVEARKEKTTKYPGSKWNNKLGALIDLRRKDVYQNMSEHFLNYYFLTITYQVKSDIQSKGVSFLYKENGNKGQDYLSLNAIRQELQFFKDKTGEIISYISSRLFIQNLNNNETATYIHSSISALWEPRLAPKQPMFMDYFISDKDVKTGEVLKIGDKYVAMISVMDFPTDTYPAMFNMLNQASVEYRWVTRWISLNKQSSAKLIEKYQKRFNNSRKSWGQVIIEASANVSTDRTDPAAEAFEADTDEAKVELANDIVSFGYYTATLEVWDESYSNVIDKAKYISSLINQCGFGSKIEKSNTFQSWLGSLPGNVYHNVRKILISSGNCAHLIPLSSVWTGDFSNKWTNEMFGVSSPLLTCSSYGSPFFLNMNVGDVFHSFIFGPAGAGKSTFLCLLEAMYLKYKDSQIIVLDKDKSARGVCMASGGSYVEPGASDCAFQPLRNLDTEEDLVWACEFIELCLSEQKINLTAEQKEIIREALIQMRDTKAPGKRTITIFQQYVQDEEISVGIQPYTYDGTYGKIFDAEETSIDIARFAMIEMGTLMKLGEACVTPALMYLFKFIESHFADPQDKNGHPTLLVMDEAWVFLDNPYFAKKIEEWLVTLRKKRVAVVFATQEVAKAANSKISTTIISQCQTRFYLADPNAGSEAIRPYYKLFGLDDSEIDMLSGARMKNDYFYKSVNGARMFQLDLDGYQLALINPDSKILNSLEKKYGRNSGKQLAPEILYMQGYDPNIYLKA